MKRVLVTGGTGFIGERLISELLGRGYRVSATYRKNSNNSIINRLNQVDWFVCDLSELLAASDFPNDIDVVIHLAGLAHQVGHEQQAWDYIYKSNVESTGNLAKIASDLGVKQFIFLSTIKAYGEESNVSKNLDVIPFDHTSDCHPIDNYARSKKEAELLLKSICSKCSMSYTIIRPPLVFGPGVKANFLQLIKFVDKQIPLPIANVDNSKSLIYVDNLIDAIISIINCPRAKNKIFPIKDIDVSTAKLAFQIAIALGKKPRVFPFPQQLLLSLLSFIGKKEQYRKLTSSLTVDDSYFKEAVEWRPVITFESSVQNTINWYMN